MPRWRLTVEYDGRDFVGWAIQPNGLSVQEVMERALAKVLCERVRAEAAGRTDAGVHALGQVVAVTTAAEREPRALRDGVNANLPPSVAVVEAVRVPDSFNPRRDAKRKLYRYTWWDRRVRSPLERGRVWYVRQRLDVAAMQAAGQLIVGQHDYASFRANGCASTHAVRRIDQLTVSRVGDRVQLDVIGPAFLRHQIRIIAGTLCEVGLGRKPPEWMAKVLAARDRTIAGRTAPPQGLTLMWIEYTQPSGRPGA